MEKLNIQIDKPCAENFKNFKKTEDGGFCNSCKKNVIDFTKMSDQAILNYFNNEKSKTCGIFLESQLKNYSNTNLALSKKKSNPFVRSLFGLSLLSSLSFTNSFSQEKTIDKETVQKEKINTNLNLESSESNELFIVNGIVSDAAGPLPGANVYSKKYNIGIQTDIDGKFIFPKQLKKGDVLIVSFIGYKDAEIIVTKENQSTTLSCDIKLKNCEMVMIGEVSTSKMYKSKRTLIQKIKSLFTND